MAIRFRCDCGRVLMASEDQAGLEGQCPACGRVVTIPREGTVTPEENNQGLPTEPVSEQQAEDETSLDIKGLEDLDEDLEQDIGEPPERRAWFWSSRFAVLGSIAVVVVVALIVFTLVRRDREESQELVVIKQIEPLAESQSETAAPPVGAKLDESVFPPVEEEPLEPLAFEGEPAETETVSSEPILETEGETISGEGKEATSASEEQEQETIASLAPETPSVEPTAPVGAYTINIASFRKKENAEQYVEELKQMGIEAFDWEIDLPQKGKWHRVSVGGFSSRQEAEDYAGTLRQKGISDTFITRVPETS